MDSRVGESQPRTRSVSGKWGADLRHREVAQEGVRRGDDGGLRPRGGALRLAHNSMVRQRNLWKRREISVATTVRIMRYRVISTRWDLHSY
jgi:hypothetical protein